MPNPITEEKTAALVNLASKEAHLLARGILPRFDTDHHASSPSGPFVRYEDHKREVGRVKLQYNDAQAAHLEAVTLLKELRTFIDDIIPACPAGFDRLSSLKYRTSQHIAKHGVGK